MSVRGEPSIRRTTAVVASTSQQQHTKNLNQRAHQVGVPFLGQSRACSGVSTGTGSSVLMLLPGVMGHRSCSNRDPWCWCIE